MNKYQLLLDLLPGAAAFFVLGVTSASLATLLACLAPDGSWLRNLVFGKQKQPGVYKRIILYIVAGGLAAALLFIINPDISFAFALAVGFAPFGILGHFFPPGGERPGWN